MSKIGDRLSFKDAASYYTGTTKVKNLDKRILCVHIAKGRFIEQLSDIAVQFKQVDKKTYKKNTYTNCFENLLDKLQIVVVNVAMAVAVFFRHLLGLIHPVLSIKDA